MHPVHTYKKEILKEAKSLPKPENLKNLRFSAGSETTRTIFFGLNFNIEESRLKALRLGKGEKQSIRDLEF